MHFWEQKTESKNASECFIKELWIWTLNTVAVGGFGRRNVLLVLPSKIAGRLVVTYNVYFIAISGKAEPESLRALPNNLSKVTYESVKVKCQ